MAGTITATILTLMLGVPPFAPPAAQAVTGRMSADVQRLDERLRPRFQLLPLHDGIALTPRFRTAVRSIEVSAGTIAVDGDTVTGSELRQKLGQDAELILQLSYLDPASLRMLLGLGDASRESETQAATPSTLPTRAEVRRGDIVRFGGSVTVLASETVTGDVVVIGGAADVDGRVEGELVVIGGTARLGPHAEIRRDVTVIGGKLDRDPNSVIGGKVDEVGAGNGPMVDGAGIRNRLSNRLSRRWPFLAAISPAVRVTGTFVRVALLVLLSWLVVLVGKTPVERIAERAAAEPVKSWAVGFLAEILLLPLVILTVVTLAISIVGIPLLPLVPVALVGLCVVFLVGFAAVAYHIGQRVQGRADQGASHPYLATLFGIGIIVSPLLLGRVVGMTGSLGFLATALVAIGGLLEYIAWTVGLGAAALVRFGRPLASVNLSPAFDVKTVRE